MHARNKLLGNKFSLVHFSTLVNRILFIYFIYFFTIPTIISLLFQLMHTILCALVRIVKKQLKQHARCNSGGEGGTVYCES